MSDNCLLSLALIMRDAAGEVLECLKSVAEAVDEMVVVDTGSVDDSVAVVKGYLEQWHKEKPGRQWLLLGVKWRDDFAHAKNQALLRCHGQYVIFLDSDERLSEETRGNLRPLVEKLSRGGWTQGLKFVELPDRPQSPSAEGPDVVEIWRDNIDLEGNPVPEPGDSSVRLIRRQENFVYIGEVHEQLFFTDGRLKEIATADKNLLRILHTGYRPGLKEQKDERNNRILLKEEQVGGRTRLKDHYLAELHRDRKEWVQAYNAAIRCLNGSRPTHYKNSPYCIALKSLQELEKAALKKAGVAPAEGIPIPEPQEGEPAVLQQVRQFRNLADNVIRRGLDEFPDYPDVYYYRGLRRKNRGEKAGAYADFLKARELAETFTVKYPEEFFSFRELLPELKEVLSQVKVDQQEHPEEYRQPETAGPEQWHYYVGRAGTLGGRMIRRQLSLEEDAYKVLEDTQAEERQAEKGSKGLLLPFLEIGRENVKEYLPKVALALQNARGFQRIILMLREPLPEILSLLARHQEKGLPCTAVCAAPGVLFGGEKPGELHTPVEELLDLMRERAESSSPRKRLLLPYREQELLRLKYVWDLAGAAVFALKHDKGTVPLLINGEDVTYGQLVEWARELTGFAGKVQFGKGRLPKAEAVPAGLRTMQADRAQGMKRSLAHLACKRKRQGGVFLSACVIMRDSEVDIARCLESLRQADELIVVDTGSVDKSVEIAKRYTDKVYHFEWIDDFSAAKNFALSYAQGEVIVFLDSDEFFNEESAASLHRLAEDLDIPGGERQFLVRILNLDKHLQPLREKDAEGSACRFFSGDVHFVGAVHEAMETPTGQVPPKVMIPRERCLVMHTGYDPERMQAKKERNARLLRMVNEAGEELPLQHYNMGKILMGEKKYEEARAEMILARQAEIVPANLRAEIYRMWYHASKMLGDEQAMKESMVAMRQDMPLMPDSYVIEAQNLWREGRKEEAAPLYLRAMELSRDFLKYNAGEVNELAKYMPMIAEVLAGFYEERGEKEMAERVRNILTAL